MTDATEIELRLRWYDAHVRRFEANGDIASRSHASTAGFDASASEALGLRDALARNGDLEEFRSGLQEWAVKPGTLAFNGFSGQMFVNQLTKSSDDPDLLAQIFIDVLALPSDAADAAAKLGRLVDYVESIRVGAHPAPGHTNFLVSYFWGLEDHVHWPVFWASAVSFVEYLTGESLPNVLADRYVRYRELAGEIDDDNRRLESVASWWHESKPTFFDSVLVDRCAHALDLPDNDPAKIANASALIAISGYLGTELAERLSRVVGRSLTPKKPPLMWSSDSPRGDVWVDWWVKDLSGLGLRVWINQEGASIGLRPGKVRTGWLVEAADIAKSWSLAEYKMLAGARSDSGDDVGHHGGLPGEFTYARWYDSAALDALDLEDELVAVAAQTQPLIEQLVQLATGETSDNTDDPLAALVEDFRARGYPTPADEEHRADRERFAAILAPDAIATADVAELRRIWNTGRYGGPGPQSGLNISVRDADAAEYDRIIRTFRFICWGDGEDAERIDSALTDGEYYVKGLGEAVAVKLLAICHPDRYIPVFPVSGPKGKLRMLQLLAIPAPVTPSRGQLQVQTNDLLRKRLDALFSGDPWGMASFLYWFAEREIEPEVSADVDPLDELADDLLVDRAFLDDIVDLLEEKGQVVFYGPPGTGKTYIARKIAEVLAPNPTRRSLVQFHPSTSYEDFFEGYRPETGPNGEMTYHLTPGPLALLAEQASNEPGKRHVMIIDEINRANLPKVLGELLFLFEYRGEQVRTLYRPDDAFDLPKDLFFIATMNTADRSIALVDAALRRRFHFIPFFPNDGPMKGLLDRWLQREAEPAWVGELVAMVNDELIAALGGPHLQLGPSHFMKHGLDELRLRRIWEYDIEPFVEDQFFGDASQIERFRFASVLARYRSNAGLDDPDIAGLVESVSGALPIESTVD